MWYIERASHKYIKKVRDGKNGWKYYYDRIKSTVTKKKPLGLKEKNAYKGRQNRQLNYNKHRTELKDGNDSDR